jgi:hypothetical protein
LIDDPDPNSTTARPGPTIFATSAECRASRPVSILVG